MFTVYFNSVTFLMDTLLGGYISLWDLVSVSLPIFHLPPSFPSAVLLLISILEWRLEAARSSIEALTGYPMSKLITALIASALIPFSASPGIAEEIFSEREKIIIVDFYNSGRGVGMIETACLLARNGQIPDSIAMSSIKAIHTVSSREVWAYAKFRLLGSDTLYKPCKDRVRLLK